MADHSREVTKMPLSQSEFERRVADAKAKMRRTPVFSLSELWALPPDEIEEGYHDGWEGFSCSDNRSRAYWHGWSNARRDRHEQEPTWQSRNLAAESLAYGLTKVLEEHAERFASLRKLGLADTA